MLQDYVKNTHAETHQQYEMEIVEVGKLSTVEANVLFLRCQGFAPYPKGSGFCRSGCFMFL